MNAERERISTIGILVLEDDPVHRLLLEHEFQGGSYSLKSAADAAAALQLIRSEDASYQIGIFDLKVPADVGDFPQTDAALKVIEAARKCFPRMVIVTISSIFIGEDVQARLDAVGAKPPFSKPFSLEKLHVFVDSCAS